MALEEIKGCNQPFLTAADIAPVLDCDPQAIRDTAQHNPERLGFPVTVLGTRTKIPRKAFLRFLGEIVD